MVSDPNLSTGSLHSPSLPPDELTNLCRPGAEERIRWKKMPYMLD